MRRGLDLHNHVMPGVDDGAQDAAEARRAVEALTADGTGTVVATPHFDGSLTRDPAALAARLAELDEGWDRLTDAVADHDLALARGVEMRLDVPEVDLSDPRIRLGGGRSVLVEFPYFTVPPRSAPVLAELRRQGALPLLAHPERYDGLDAELAVVASWLDAGAFLQVNAPSLTGRYGDRAQRVALELLARGWVHCVASDYHARGEPRLAEARRRFEAWGGEEQARLLLEENPTRLLNGEECLAVEPLQPTRSVRASLRALLPW